MKTMLGMYMVLGGLAFAAWLGGYVMLYQGIAAAIAHPNAGSILKAVFFEAGLLPGFAVVILGVVIIDSES